ncbi:cell division protein FtsK [Planococcus kocurii]|uniref:cell division protein FtsK n=1 Tax=Planococcus kocurii TaxID=1374 RepID=UPI003D034149
MNVFKNTIEFLNRMKVLDVWGDKMDGISEKEQEELDKIPTQNPYGLIGMVFGGIAFIVGPQYGFIPVIALIFCLVTFFTFDKEKEDNPWPFYLGIVLSMTGLAMFMGGATHILS